MRHKTLTWLLANLLIFGLAFASVGLSSGCGDGGGATTAAFSEDAKKKAMEELQAEQKAMQGSKDYAKTKKKAGK